MAVVRTVLGDIPAEQIGVTIAHEHITFSWGSAPRDLGELYDREAYVKQVSDDLGAAKRDYNVNTLVDVTTAEMGRDVELCAAVQRQTGVNIVASTGSYRQNGGMSLYWNSQTAEEFEEYMIKEITEGVGRNKVKCGNMKMGWSTYQPTPAEERHFRAAGRVSRKLDISIDTHTPFFAAPIGYNPGLQMVEILTTEGADPSKIKIDHCTGLAGKLGPMLDILRRGVYVSFEGLGISEEINDRVISSVGALIAAGYVNQIMLSMDHIGIWQPAQPQWNIDNWIQDWSFLHRVRISRMLEAGISEKNIEQMMVINPMNHLGF